LHTASTAATAIITTTTAATCYNNESSINDRWFALKISHGYFTSGNAC
jgi:hypothetical protein